MQAMRGEDTCDVYNAFVRGYATRNPSGTGDVSFRGSKKFILPKEEKK